jgi:hypothetical protein
MVNTQHTLYTRNSLPQPTYNPTEGTTLRRVRQDKPHPTSVRAASTQPVVRKNIARTRRSDTKSTRPQNYFKKHSTKRQTVQLSGWGRKELKAELKHIADSEGISLSQTVVAACEKLVHQKRQTRREILEKPILEAFFDKKMNHLINRLSEFIARSVYEGGQLRWLYINKLYRDVLHPDKKLTKEEFYKLLDTSQKETIKAVKKWNPNIQDIVAAIRQWLKEEEHA